MTDYEKNLKEGYGSMNKWPKKKDNDPDYNGSFKLNDKIYKVAGWIKDSQNGNKFLSITVQNHYCCHICLKYKRFYFLHFVLYLFYVVYLVSFV